MSACRTYLNSASAYIKDHLPSRESVSQKIDLNNKDLKTAGVVAGMVVFGTIYPRAMADLMIRITKWTVGSMAVGLLTGKVAHSAGASLENAKQLGVCASSTIFVSGFDSKADPLSKFMHLVASPLLGASTANVVKMIAADQAKALGANSSKKTEQADLAVRIEPNKLHDLAIASAFAGISGLSALIGGARLPYAGSIAATHMAGYVAMRLLSKN